MRVCAIATPNYTTVIVNTVTTLENVICLQPTVCVCVCCRELYAITLVLILTHYETNTVIQYMGIAKSENHLNKPLSVNMTTTSEREGEA